MDAVEEEITGLIKICNFKKCYEVIRVLRKRYPNSKYLDVLELYVRYKQSPSKFDYESSLNKKYGISGTACTTDYDALRLLHKFFCELGKYEEALSIYKKANSLYPSFELCSLWYDQALIDSNYQHLALATGQLHKYPDSVSFPVRNFQFWHALATVALFKFQPYRLTENEKLVLPTLIYKYLTNLKPFQSAQELIVFCTVCQELFPNDSSKSKEIVQEIRPHLKVPVDLYLKNFILRHSQEVSPQLYFEICSELLDSIDDYEVLKRLVECGAKLGKTQQEVLDLVAKLLGDTRNSRLIRFELDLQYNSDGTGNDGLISEASLQYYLERFHNKPCCPTDIAHYIADIDKDMLKKLLCGETSQQGNGSNDDLMHDANEFTLFPPEDKSRIQRSIELYNKHKASLGRKSEVDYSALSTFILTIVRDHILSDDPTLEDIILALTILENYQQRDKHNYNTLVWIIAIYMYLGVVPIAYSRFLGLNIKNVQVDTVAFLVYSRYSTVFPNKQHDYLRKTLKEGNSLYSSSLDRLPQFIRVALERKAYSKIIGMLEFRDRLRCSQARWSRMCESLQLARLCNDKRADLLEDLHACWREVEATGDTKLYDNNEFSIFGFADHMNWTHLPRVLQYLDVRDGWVYLSLIKEFMIEVIPTQQRSPLVDGLLVKILGDRPLESVLSKFLSAPEQLSFQIFYDLYKRDGATLEELLGKMNIDELCDGTWELSHTYTTYLATLKTLDNFKRTKVATLRVLIKDKLKKLREVCDEKYSSYKDELRSVSEKLAMGDKAGILNALGYKPLDITEIIDALTIVQKTVRNL